LGNKCPTLYITDVHNSLIKIKERSWEFGDPYREVTKLRNSCALSKLISLYLKEPWDNNCGFIYMMRHRKEKNNGMG